MIPFKFTFEPLLNFQQQSRQHLIYNARVDFFHGAMEFMDSGRRERCMAAIIFRRVQNIYFSRRMVRNEPALLCFALPKYQPYKSIYFTKMLKIRIYLAFF